MAKYENMFMCAYCYHRNGIDHPAAELHEIFHGPHKQFAMRNHFQIPLCRLIHNFGAQSSKEMRDEFLMMIFPGFDIQRIVYLFNDRVHNKASEAELIEIGKLNRLSRYEYMAEDFIKHGGNDGT